MKYAFMSFSTPKQTLSQMISTAEELGYAGIEPRIQSKHAHGVELEATEEQKKEIRDKIASSNVDICCLATSLKYCQQEDDTTVIKNSKELIQFASEVNIPRLRVFGGEIPDGVSRETAITRIIDTLSKLASFAEDHNVDLCLETHDDWTNPVFLTQVMEGINHSSIGLTWDILHPILKGFNMTEVGEALKPWIKHVHIHDHLGAQKGWTSIGNGIVDHKAALECLNNMSFDGYLSGEWIGWNEPEEHLGPEIATMKKLETTL